MPVRITFKKLVELVEKETGLDNKNSDKLLRRWFSIINEGLERDGRVRISKFGIFKLQAVKQRNGINPSTREAMVIPAHTKVVFKSAKHLKETVNKKYNLLEAKPIIMADKKSEKKVPKSDTSKKAETEKKVSDTEIDNLISQIDESHESDGKELKNVDTPEPKKEETKINQIKKKQSEEIRAKIEEKFTNKENDFTPTGVMSAAPDKKPDKTEEKITEKVVVNEDKTTQKKEKIAEVEKPLEDKVNVIIEKDKVEKKPESPLMQRRLEEEKKSKMGLWIAIVFIILLLIILLIWKPWEESEEVVVEKQPIKEIVKPEPQTPVVKKAVYKTPGGEHAVNRGDKLWDLSDDYYKDAYLWPNIYRVNDKSISNPDILIIGNVVTVPPLEGTHENLTTKDSVNISVGFYKAYKAYKKYGNEWAKYYLWVCKKYDRQTFNDNKPNVNPDDFQFALNMN